MDRVCSTDLPGQNRVRRRPLMAVFLLSMAGLSFGIQKSIIASAYTDPVSRIRAQDESVYSHAAIRMARGGDWLTPKFLGRYFLYKPPLLLWLAGLTMKAFGVSLWALRLPVLLAGALAATLVFSWVWRVRSGAAAAGAAILLVSNNLWHTYSRINQTDALLAASIVAAVSCLARDPTLAGRWNFLGFGLFTAAALMTKSIAGLLPPLIWLVYCGLARGGPRPSLRRFVEAGLLIAALALPWHLYQAVVHPEWFWAEYLKLQIFGFGVNPPSQTSQEGQLWFYVKRLALTDPVLCVFVVAAAPGLWVAARRREGVRPVLLVSWILVAGGSLVAFRYRNLHYLLPLIPALCILAAGYGPLFARGRQAIVLAVLGAVFFVKGYHAAPPWGLDFAGGNPSPSATALRAYCERWRPNELIVVSSDEDFYSAVLPLPHVRYCFIDSLQRFEGYGPHFVYLGITMSSEQFNALDQGAEPFWRRMQAWKLDSAESMGTAIVAGSVEDVLQVIQTHPQSDFYLPVEMRSVVGPLVKSTHDIAPGTPERFFLLARAGPVGAPARPRLPRYW
ncbi:MAG: glycosyltransferase family 39 protein [Acidobacteria bacterium]|nr:glycosyltransferase family 39 protein [Acidobacteriota bacterium]